MTDLTFVPGVVEACATSADGLGRTISGLSGGFANTDTTTARYAALASAQALAACRTGWSGRISQQGAGTTATGHDLHQVVKSYTATDSDNAAGIRHSSSGPRAD